MQVQDTSVWHGRPLLPAKGKPGDRVCTWRRASNPRDAESQLQGQKDDLEALCAHRGYVASPQHDIAEDGISGQLYDDRKALGRILAWARNREIDGVVVRDRKRISRGYPWVCDMIEQQLARHGCWIEYMNGDVEREKKTTDAVMMRYVKGFEGLIEWCILRDRIVGMLENKARKGFMWGGPTADAYGWRWHVGGEAGGYWEIDESEFRWVRLIHEWYDQGESLRGIVRRLTAEGAPTKKGSVWSPQTVRHILTKEKHTGLFRPLYYEAIAPTKPYQGRTREEPRQENRSHRRRADDERPEGIDLLSGDLGEAARWFRVDVRALVPRDQWLRNQAKLVQNRDRQPPRKRPPSLLDGKVRCGCDHGDGKQRSMTLNVRTNHPAAWRCLQRRDVTKSYCPCRIRADLLERAVWSRLVEISLDPARVLADLLKDDLAMVERRERAAATIAKAEAELNKLVDAAARLRAEYAIEPYERAEFERALALIETRRKAAEQNLADARAHLHQDEPSSLPQPGRSARLPEQSAVCPIG